MARFSIAPALLCNRKHMPCETRTRLDLARRIVVLSVTLERALLSVKVFVRKSRRVLDGKALPDAVAFTAYVAPL